MRVTTRRLIRRSAVSVAVVMGTAALVVAAPSSAWSTEDECEPPGGLLGLSIDQCGIQASVLGIDVSLGGSSGGTTEPVPEPEPAPEPKPEPQPEPKPEPEPAPAPAPTPSTDAGTPPATSEERPTSSTAQGVAAHPVSGSDGTAADDEVGVRGGSGGGAAATDGPSRLAGVAADRSAGESEEERGDGDAGASTRAADGAPAEPPGQVTGPAALLGAGQQVGPAEQVTSSAEGRRGIGPISAIAVAAVLAVLMVAAAEATRIWRRA